MFHFDSDLDSPIWSDLNISDEGLGSPGDSLSLDDCFQDTSDVLSGYHPDGNAFDSCSGSSHSPGGLTPPYTPATSDRSTPPSNENQNHIPTIDQQQFTFHQQQACEQQLVTINPSSPFVQPPYQVQYYQPQLIPTTAPLLMVQPPNNRVTIVPASVNTGTTTCPTVPKVTASSTTCPPMSVKEARRIRNRESANNSRMKQKETMEQLKKQVTELKKENVDLKQENCSLRVKIKFLEEQINSTMVSVKATISGSKSKVSKKRAMSFLAVILVLGFNISPFINVFNPDASQFSPLPSDQLLRSSKLNGQSIKESHGRSLLWTSDVESLNLTLRTLAKDESNETNNFIGTGLNNTISKSGSNQSELADCGQKYLNKTDTIRMENDLRGWVQRIKGSQKGSDRKNTARGINKLFDRGNLGPKKPIPVARMKHHLMSLNYDYPIADGLDGINPINELIKKNMDKLLESIHRRSDTFYFVSFSAMDTMLLPADSDNGTKTMDSVRRPRFSLIMPSLTTTINETDLVNGVNSTFNLFSMMQIDCEVMNTKTVVVKNLINGPGGLGTVGKTDRQSIKNNVPKVMKKDSLRVNGNSSKTFKSRKFVNETLNN